MLTVIFLILKIIGITLAVLVGLILLFVLLLLFVPFRYGGMVRYPIEGDNDKEIRARSLRDNLKAKVMPGVEMTEGMAPEEKKKLPLKTHVRLTWLLHLLSVNFDYDNTTDVLKVKLFGFTLFSTDPEYVKKKEEKEKRKKEKAKRKKEKEKAKRRKKKEKERAKRKRNGEVTAAAGQPDMSTGAASQKTSPPKEAQDGRKAEKKDQTPKEAQDGKPEEKSFDSLTDEELDALLDADNTDKEEPPKKSIVDRLKSIYNKVKGIHDKIMNYKAFADDYGVRKAVKYIRMKLKLILKRVLPRKMKGHAEFGFDNPATTGYVAGALSIFLRLWDGKFEVTPDFENKKLAADAEFKGRLRIAGVAFPALRVWLNSDVKYLRRAFGELKEGKYVPPKPPAAQNAQVQTEDKKEDKKQEKNKIKNKQIQ